VDLRFWVGVGAAVAAVYILRAAPSDSTLAAAYQASAVAIVLAGAPQSIAAVAEHARDRANRRERELAAYDETRRVCLIALAHRQPSPEAVVTAVNALTYHSRIMPPEVAARIISELYYKPITLDGFDRFRLTEYVNELCRRRGDPPLYSPSTLRGRSALPESGANCEERPSGSPPP